MLSRFGSLQCAGARLLTRLPHALQLLLSRRPPVIRDGLSLHPEVQLLLTLRALLGSPALTSGTPQEARRRARKEALTFRGPLLPVRSVRDHWIQSTDGHTVRARHYAPQVEGPAPLLVYLHGGGFVIGDVDTYDSACRRLASFGRFHVLSVEYRLAPEHRFPAALDDVRAVFQWAVAHAEALGADPKRVAIGGDSAGGNLAAVATRLLTREGLPPALQLLIYPATDCTQPHASLELFAEGFFLTREDIRWFIGHYLGALDGSDVCISPLLAEDLHGLPPAIVITAGFDPLRDEGEKYAAALSRAGTPSVLRRFDRLTHGFLNFASVSPACEQAVEEVAALVRSTLGGEQRTDHSKGEAA